MSSAGKTRQARIVIIGTGFSGIALAYYLKKAGIHDFIMLEKAAEVGGTWRENTYPGAECDVPSALYSFSFEHNAEWQYKWAEQHQIFDYLRHVAQKEGLYPHIRFSQEAAAAAWDETGQCWRVTTAQGEMLDCQFLVSAVGQLHHASMPAIPGADNFHGPQFHTAHWRHDVELAGKRIAVIGNAASALQLIPQLAKTANQVSVFQRSANWVLPKRDYPYGKWQQWLSDKLPWITKLYRFRLWLRNETVMYGVMHGNPFSVWFAKRENRRYLNRTIADPTLRAALTPDYPMGAKRVLVSDNYYEALARPNVTLVTDAVTGLTENGVRCADGREIPADVLVYGTGFRTNPFLAPMAIHGIGGVSLRDSWKHGAHAYLGITTHGFPNLFMMYGPNTHLGHNSIVIMSEAQARYIVQCIEGLAKRGALSLDVRRDVEQRYNDVLQERLKAMVWNTVEASWYKDGSRITNNWPGTTYEYLRRCRKVRWADFQFSGSA